MDTARPSFASGNLIACLGSSLIVLGTGGMAAGFLFLCSQHALDVTAGAAGFLAGTVFVAAGVVTLAVLSQSPVTRVAAAHAVGCLWGFLPPAVAILSWPALYFTVFLGACVVLPFVLVGCVIWAWRVSARVTWHLWWLLGPAGPEPPIQLLGGLRAVVLGFQVLGIVASWPLFGELLGWLTAMGYKVGWS
jgi:hypothetical protein